MNNVSARFKLRQLFVSCFVTCDALSVLFQIPFVQQRPVPCTGLHCTPPRKAREIKDPQVLCPLHRALCLCVSCVLFCLSVFCAQRRSSKPDLSASFVVLKLGIMADNYWPSGHLNRLSSSFTMFGCIFLFNFFSVTAPSYLFVLRR